MVRKNKQIYDSQPHPISPHKHIPKRRKQFQTNSFLMKTGCRFFSRLFCSYEKEVDFSVGKKKIKNIKGFLFFIPEIFLFYRNTFCSPCFSFPCLHPSFHGLDLLYELHFLLQLCMPFPQYIFLL